MSLATVDIDSIQQELLFYLGCKHLVKIICGYATMTLDLELQRELVNTVERRESTVFYANVVLKREHVDIPPLGNRWHLLGEIQDAIEDDYREERKKRLMLPPEKETKVVYKYFWPQAFYHFRLSYTCGENEASNVLIEYSSNGVGRQSDYKLDKAHPEMRYVGKWIVPVTSVNEYVEDHRVKDELYNYQFQIDKLTEDKLSRYERAMKDWRKSIAR